MKSGMTQKVVVVVSTGSRPTVMNDLPAIRLSRKEYLRVLIGLMIDSYFNGSVLQNVGR